MRRKTLADYFPEIGRSVGTQDDLYRAQKLGFKTAAVYIPATDVYGDAVLRPLYSVVVLLGYAALIAPGIVLQKDGSLLASWEIQGQDTASATPEELAYVSMQFSNAVRHLGTGWMLHVDAVFLDDLGKALYLVSG